MFTSRMVSIDQAARRQLSLTSRSGLTHLAQLVAANPSIAERLLRGDPIDTAIAHPHYAVSLDERDRAMLHDIRTRAQTVGALLWHLADAVDGPLAE